MGLHRDDCGMSQEDFGRISGGFSIGKKSGQFGNISGLPPSSRPFPRLLVAVKGDEFIDRTEFRPDAMAGKNCARIMSDRVSILCWNSILFIATIRCQTNDNLARLVDRVYWLQKKLQILWVQARHFLTIPHHSNANPYRHKYCDR